MIATLSVKPDCGIWVACTNCMEQKELLKANSFQWQPERKVWQRFMECDPNWPPDFYERAWDIERLLLWLHGEMNALIKATDSALGEAVAVLFREEQ